MPDKKHYDHNICIRASHRDHCRGQYLCELWEVAKAWDEMAVLNIFMVLATTPVIAGSAEALQGRCG
jgi:hypothetical protein